MLRPAFRTGRVYKTLSVVVTVFFLFSYGITFSVNSISSTCSYSSMSGAVRVKRDDLICIPLVYASDTI